MTTFITRLDAASSTGPTLALKDLIDVEGVPTTAGSPAVAAYAAPAARDAALLGGARAEGAVIVGKTNLYELAFGASGVNPHYGTPRNPLDASRIPGGSSSGSAVAVADGDAVCAYGSDSGGSIRVPAAFCGIVGLKPTHGRIPLEGVYPLAPSLDTVGPMARDVAGVTLGMQLLEPGFAPARAAARLGLVDPDGVLIDPAIRAAVERACRAADRDLVGVDVPGWLDAYDAGATVLLAEAVVSNRAILADATRAALLGDAVRTRLAQGARVGADELARARAFRATWQTRLNDALGRCDLLVLPTVGFFPPPLEEAADHIYTHLTMPMNFAGYPAIALPVPCGRFPASVQLIGPPGSEEVLVATAAVLERANPR